MSPTLKPCPFCQATQEDGNYRLHGDWWYVFCKECGASANDAPTWKDAVVAWNTRSDANRIAELEAENARLQDVLTVIANGPCEWPVDAFLAAQCARRALGGEE